MNLDTDPTNDSLSGDHGTSDAGISISVGWNNKGGRGVAPEASLIGYNFLKNATNSNEYYSWGVNPPGGVVSDIYNLSYGTAMGDGYALPYTAANQNSSLEAAMINVTSVQRNGNGAYLVKSSANNSLELNKRLNHITQLIEIRVNNEAK